MTYGVVLEKIVEPGFEGYYYAHIPTLGLTTHGLGIDGALAMADDLVTLWIEELEANGEPVPEPTGLFLSTLEVNRGGIHVA